MKVKLNFKLYKKYLGLPFKDIMKRMRIKQNVNLIKEKYEMYSTKKINKIKIKRNHVVELKKLKKLLFGTIYIKK